MKLLLIIALAVLPCAFAMPGGATKYTPDSNDDEVVFAMDAIIKHFQARGLNGNVKLVSIVSATKQVVSGTKYQITVRVSGMNQPEDCSVEFWSQPWLEKTTITRAVTCEVASAMSNAGMPGAPTEVSLDGEMVQAALRAIENHVNSASNSMFYFTVSNEPKVTSQIVNGVRFEFTNVELSETNCKNSDVFAKVDAGDADPTANCEANATAAPKKTGDFTVFFDATNQKYTVSETQ